MALEPFGAIDPLGRLMNQSGNLYHCSIATGPDGLAALDSEWADLLGRSPGAYVSEGAAWARICWLTRAAQGGRQLLCLVVRHGARLTAVMPLIVFRSGPFRLASPLACMTTEYCPLLMDPAAEAQGVWEAMVDGLRRLAAVDAVVLPNVRDDAALAEALRCTPRMVKTDSLLAHILCRSAFESWESYWNHLPQTARANLQRRERRLAELGEVQIEELADVEARRAAWAWMLSHKRDWLARKRLDHAFIPTDEYSRFTEATLNISGPAGRRTIFALKLNGKVLAAHLVNVDRRRMEGFVCTYDPAFAKYGPGQLLTKELLRRAFAQELDYDWRLGDEDYKREWASHVAVASTYALPQTLLGRLFAAYLVRRTWLARRTPPGLRARIRGLLRSRAGSLTGGDREQGPGDA